MSTMTSPDELDLSAGQYIKGIQLSPTIFLAVTKFSQLHQVTRNPVDLQPGARRRMDDAELAEEAEIHDLIQRILAGNKKSNVPSYREYIERVVQGGLGVLPPMHLWSAHPLRYVQQGTSSYVLVPNGEYLLAIDGETQLTAHWALNGARTVTPEVKEKHRQFGLAAVVHHGISVVQARQYFHDLNVLAVRPNTSLGLSMDTQDPVMKVVGDLEAAIDTLQGRVDKQSRQLPKRSSKIVTLQSLRQMVVNIAKGISGVQYGARPAPMDDIDVPELSVVARDWVGRYFDTFAVEIADRENHLAGAGPVLAAVGALGHQVFRAAAEKRPERTAQLIESLRQVDWTKGDHWLGIAGNFTPGGVFSVKGTKEVAYAIFNALVDPENSGYARIRRQPTHRVNLVSGMRGGSTL